MGKAFSLISPETSLLVSEELELVFKSLLLGSLMELYIIIKYFVMRFFHIKGAFLHIEDFITATALSIALFLFCLKFNFGIIRWYIPASALLGGLFFRKFAGHFTEKILTLLLSPFAIFKKAAQRHLS